MPGSAIADPTPALSLFGGGRGKVLLFCWLGWVFDFYDLILFSFSKRTIARDPGLDGDVAVAWIEGLMLLSTAAGGFACGRLADRIGRRQAMVVSIVLFSLGALLTGLANGFWSLLLARLVAGLGVGGEWGIGHAVVADHWSGPQRDRVHGLLQAGSPVAMALAAAVAFFVAPLPGIGWRAVFLGSAGLAVLALWARAALPGPDRAVVGAAPAPARLLWSSAHRRASAVLLLVLVLHMAGFWCVYAELPAALIVHHGVAPADVGWFQIQVNAVHVAADVLFGWLAARFGRVRLFVLSCLLFAAGHALVLALLGAVTSAFGAFTLAVAAMGLGAGTWSCFGALFGAHYPAVLRATAAASFYALARAVQLPLKPALGALFAATGSFAPALWIGMACALGSAVAVLWLPRAAGKGRDSAPPVT
ncbi:MAG: MFS transporter [Planctomycetes bacterium]|nr:MFS transporter [Planctomycetota bacterium]